MNEETYNELLSEFNVLGIKLNNFITSVTKLMKNDNNSPSK